MNTNINYNNSIVYISNFFDLDLIINFNGDANPMNSFYRRI